MHFTSLDFLITPSSSGSGNGSNSDSSRGSTISGMIRFKQFIRDNPILWL